MIAIDNKCVLCGTKIEHRDETYSYDHYLHEIDKCGSVYCRQCKEILRCEEAKPIKKKNILKVPIRVSDYPLPGFVPLRNGTYHKPLKKKGFFEEMLFGKRK